MEVQSLEVLEVLQDVLRHLVDLVAVPGHFLVENTSPHQGVELVLRFHSGLTVDEEVEVEVATDAEQVILNVFDLFEFPQNLDCFHLRVDKLVECQDKLFSQLKCEFVFAEISQTRVQEPNV